MTAAYVIAQTMAPVQPDMRAAALYWIGRGFRVFPCSHSTKAPLVENGFLEAANDALTVSAWWERWPTAAIGAAPGPGLLCLDVDAPGSHKKTPEGGFETFAALQAAHPEAPIPRTFAVKTGSGGAQFWLAYDPTRFRITQGQGRVGRGIDHRAEAGYGILPPSLHPSGARYDLLLDAPFATAPDWLCALCEQVAAPPAPPAPPPSAADAEQIAHARRVLHSALERLRACPVGEGTGRDALVRESFIVGGLWALPRAARRAALLGVVLGEWEEPFEPEHEAHRIIDGRLAAGEESPLSLGPDLADQQIQGFLDYLDTLPLEAGGPPPPTIPDPNRPIINISTEIFTNANEAIAALALDSNRAGGDPVRDRVYQRDGSLTRVVYLAETEANAPRLVPLKLPTLRENLTRVARWVATKSTRGETAGMVTSAKMTLPPDNVTMAVAERREYPGIRPIAGIAETPAFLRDGSILETPGYDGRSGFVYVPSAAFPGVPANPSQNDAAAALAMLDEVWCDFPYKTAQDREVPKAALLTQLARPAIGAGNCPAFLFDANTRGSGKTRQVDALSVIATGRPFAKTTFPSDNEEELEKMLGGFAVSGAAIAAFDNVTGHFGGGPLDKVLTCGGSVQLRILGRTETPKLTWYAIVIATGNNVVVVGDTARRTLVSRLESEHERPEDRTDFRHPDLLGWVGEERARLVVAGLTILRAWHVAGRPNMGIDQWGSFEAWSMVPRALAFAGAANVLDCRAELREGERENPDLEAQKLFLRYLHEHTPGAFYDSTALWELFLPAFSVPNGPGSSGTHDPLKEARNAIAIALKADPGRTPGARHFSMWLGTFKGRNVGGVRLVRKLVDGYNRWGVESV